MGDMPMTFFHLRQGMMNTAIDCKTRLVYLTEFLHNEAFFNRYGRQCFLLADTIARQCPADDGHAVLYGQMLAAQERFAEAAEQFKAHLAIDKSQYGVWEALLICEGQLQESDTLIEHARQASELFPLHLRPYLILVDEYLKREDCEKARFYLDRCMMIAPNEVSVKQLNQKISQQCR